MVKKRRTLLQRAKSIFGYITYYDEPIAKSRFQKVGISPREIDQWLDLIQLIQSMPLVTVKSGGKRTYVDTLENKFMMLMKRKFLNQDASYEDREAAILLYFRTMLTFERLKGEDVDMDELINRRWEIDRPTIMRIAEDAISKIEK